MRFDYLFLRYYGRYAWRRLAFDLCLIVIILSFSFYFFDKSAMLGFFTNKVKTEVLKLKSVNRSYAFDKLEVSPPEVVPPRIPKSCFSSDTRGCFCYDQHTIVIKDFPVDRCREIINGFSRF
ncbi:hypothetical protein [Nitrosomonas sp.]|uniref:hypothetical protein n=1 Tax=Nitrosomonas sp. TaxID=42353 RepID=UPI0032F0852D